MQLFTLSQVDCKKLYRAIAANQQSLFSSASPPALRLQQQNLALDIYA
jgi:hypothetical protein